MGQQQLLLLVLGIVIVGIAVVAGIQAFDTNQRKANADAMVNDAVRVASDVQTWVLKPTAFGGPESTESIGDATLEDIGYSSDPYTSLNGKYTLSSQAVGCTVIKGVSTRDEDNNEVYVKVTDTNPGGIETAVNPPTELTC